MRSARTHGPPCSSFHKVGHGSPMQPIVDAMLADFSRDPRAALNHRPPKRDHDGRERDRDSLFSACDLHRGRHVHGRHRVREALTQPTQGRSHELEDLVDHVEHHNLAAMDDAHLRSAELEVAPWSDDHWPVYLGGLGQRYADPHFPLAGDWSRNHAYVQAHPVHEVVASGDPLAIDRLSPAEKYDLLVGDPQASLTARCWAEGRALHEQTGEVEPWMGIGHGWAMASYGLPRPLSPVDTFAADGSPLRFYPADIKALASLLWAQTDARPHFTGGRGINPDTFHLALVNQLGVARRSLILDATHDHELWNQPLYAYHYELFNPQTLRHASTLDAARVPIAAFDRDHVCRHRGPATAALVGVMMEVLYVRTSIPVHVPKDSHTRDAQRSVRYLYDLELDADADIIGGEWYTHRHPDFLWTPALSARARTPADPLLHGHWTRDRPLPEAWRRLAWHTSDSARPSPLATIVEALIARARA